MLTIDPAQTSPKNLYQLLLGTVAPRPIAWVSTVSSDGVPNLAPFSFFNAFSSNPPYLGFAVAQHDDGRAKDTLNNVRQVPEVVINMVDFSLANAMHQTSAAVPPETDEFALANLERHPAERVRPWRVAGSRAQMECIVEQIIPLGREAATTHLVLCRMLLMHLDPGILNENGRIDPQLTQWIARLGRRYYTRSDGDQVFEL
jgi:flavin reductase (DIM6/NTAB) family NADH-FMN oxidoreductase RutF